MHERTARAAGPTISRRPLAVAALSAVGWTISGCASRLPADFSVEYRESLLGTQDTVARVERSRDEDAASGCTLTIRRTVNSETLQSDDSREEAVDDAQCYDLYQLILAERFFELPDPLAGQRPSGSYRSLDVTAGGRTNRVAVGDHGVAAFEKVAERVRAIVKNTLSRSRRRQP